MKKHTFIPLLILLSATLIAAANIDFLSELKNRLDSYNQQFPQEKIYVQTDKTYYTPSENIWYKVFLTDANTHKPSTISDIFYVELIDPWGNVVAKHDHSLSNNSTTSGNFHLKDDVAGGIYKLRAYTNWQKNWGEETFFTKDITVQKIITPRLLLKLDFEQRAYGAGDEVSAKLNVTDLDDRKTNGSIAKSTVRIGGVAVQTLENETKNGETTIRFRLPKNLNTADGILQIVVTDRGTEESITRSIPIVLNKINISFYPEGGDMVENVLAKVAFQALNEFGKGADVSGEILDSKGKKVASFESFHLGMGAVTFTPKTGEKYYAKITRPQGNDSLFSLPQAQKTGYLLHLKSKTDEVLTWNIYSPLSGKAYIVGQSFGNIHFSKQISLQPGMNKLEIPTKDFPAGTAVFTLFDGQNREVCERLIFLNSDKTLNIKIEPDKEVYEPGSNAKINITTTDTDGNPVSANIGLAVVDEQLLTFADDKQDNMVSYLLFSSELKGEIQEPYFYVNPDEPKAKEALDYLMLTHGWRRFTWEEVWQPTMQFIESSEKSQSLYGFVLDKNGKLTDAEVFLLETNKNQYATKANSVQTADGCFVFHNVNMSDVSYIATKLPNQVFLFDGKPVISRRLTGKEIEGLLGELKEASAAEALAEQELFAPADMEMMFDDRLELEEVVAVGYGTMRKSDLTGAISSVSTQELTAKSVSSEQLLQGRVAGLSVEQGSGDPSIGSTMRIRGGASLSGNNHPLVVVNGVAGVDMNTINPSDVLAIDVLKDASASAIYGSRAANGVIIVTTKANASGARIPGMNKKNEPQKPRYGGVYFYGNTKRVYYQADAHIQQNRNNDPDQTTVYWNGNVRTNEKGIASVSFKNNRNSSTFRITAEGQASASGLIGTGMKRIVTRKPFSLDAKTPLFAGVGDVVNIPVMARNNTDETLSTSVYVYINEKHNATKLIDIPPQQSVTVYFPFNVEENKNLNLRIEGRTTDRHFDRIDRDMTVRQIFFPMQFNFSGRDAGQKQTFHLPEYVDGTLQAEAVCYINMLDELSDGVESIFREPYGCFEQASSSVFPSIFALQLLQTTGKDHSSFPQAMQYLESGYKKLAAYEVQGGGFEWFGKSPAHTGLSAYALIEFYEMSKIYDKVDKKMTDRNYKFILSRKDGKGGFDNNTRGLDNFSGSPKSISDAYVVYALTETENQKDVEKEYQSVLEEVLKSKDLYRMALVANAAYSMNDKENYNKLIAYFKNYLLENKFSDINVETTIVRSRGETAQRQTVGFWTMALLKDKENIDLELVEKCIEFINAGRRNGNFGCSQTTSVCLQALTKYAELSGIGKIEGSLYVRVNDVSNSQRLSKSKAKIDFAKSLKKGANEIELKFADTKEVYPYAATISWQSKTPPTSKLCPLKLTAKLASPTVKVNETVRLNITLQNTDNEGKPMGVAIIGIPGGLSLQPWQLKELQEKEVFDFYEIINDNLVIYYREFSPRETKTINLDLKAEVPGEYTGTASSTYIYYENEHKYWINGLSIKIK